MKNMYFSERKYPLNKSLIIDEDVVYYWEKILDGISFNDIEEAYDVSIEDVLFNENFVSKRLSDNISNMKISDKIHEYMANKITYDSVYLFNKRRVVFSNFFIPLINVGIEELCGVNPKYLNDTVIKNYSETLLERLGKVSLGVLIFEMYILKQDLKLKGSTPEKEYNYFNEHYLADSTYCFKLFKIYPCLLRCIIEIIIRLTDYYVKMLNNLERDSDLIIKEFCKGNAFYEIKSIEGSLSDLHKKGQAVSILELDNNVKIVYKPQSLNVESIYNYFLKEISKGCKYPMYNVKNIDKNTYGWEEFIEFIPCNDKEELARYFYRFGVLIFSNYLLNTNDLHLENLIASGEYPVIVDLETILNNRKAADNNSAKEKINSILHDSVLYSGLLPHHKFSNLGKGIDMSAIKGKSNTEFPIKIPIIKDIFTSNMRFDYGLPTTKWNHNLVTYQGRVVNPYHFLEDINCGFCDSYKYVMNNKEIFIQYSTNFENLMVRHLVQDTQRYSMILHTSLHPDFMQDGKDRQLLLCNLFKNYEDVQRDMEVVRCEIKDLLNMDIPYFQHNTSNTSLYGSDGEEIRNYFHNSSVENFRNKIRDLSLKDLMYQKTLMNIVLTDLDELHIGEMKKRGKACSYEFADSSKIKLEAIYKLADTLIEGAIFNNDKTEVNWIGMNIIGDEGNYSWDIKPLGTYLYEGMSGLSIFFRSLYEYSNIKKYGDISNAIEKELFIYTNEMYERKDDLSSESSGAFAGETSMLYTYQVLYSITRDKNYLDYAKKHVSVLDKVVEYDSNYDIVYGNAGALIALINMYKITNDKKYLKKSIKIGDILVKSQKNGAWLTTTSTLPLAGLSHGAAGIMLALGRLWAETKDDNLINSIIKGLEFEHSLFDKRIMNWKDERIHNGKKVSDQGKHTIAWCHGAAGILLSRLKMYEYMSDVNLNSIIRDIEIGVSTVKGQGFLDNNCLCHGNLGNTEILNEYLKVFDNKEVKRYSDSLRLEIAFDVTKGDFHCNNAYLYGYQLQGFMTGLSGMGYSLLRDINKDLPCVLALEV